MKGYQSQDFAPDLIHVEEEEHIIHNIWDQEHHHVWISYSIRAWKLRHLVIILRIMGRCEDSKNWFLVRIICRCEDSKNRFLVRDLSCLKCKLLIDYNELRNTIKGRNWNEIAGVKSKSNSYLKSEFVTNQRLTLYLIRATLFKTKYIMDSTNKTSDKWWRKHSRLKKVYSKYELQIFKSLPCIWPSMHVYVICILHMLSYS